MSRRQHPRAGRRIVGHQPEPPADSEPLAPVVVLAQPEVEEAAPVGEESPPLRQAQIDRLERLTAMWMQQARIAGAGEDATLFYTEPPPPPRPSRPAEVSRPRDEVPAGPEPMPADLPAPESEPKPEPKPEPVAEPRLVRDWASRHDPRSRDFDVRARLSARVPLQPRVWELGPIFDQGTTPPLPLREASGCVGMAVAAAANVLELATVSPYLAAHQVPGLLTKDDALTLYARAQDLDHVSGNAYAGTSVLAGMKAGQEAGLWAGYVWAFGLGDIAQALLQVGPVVLGLPWYVGLDDPDPLGIIVPTGAPAGGHAVAAIGLVLKRGPHPGPFLVLQQSRGPGHGDGGRVYLHHEHATRLLAGVGEAAIPVPPGGIQ